MMHIRGNQYKETSTFILIRNDTMTNESFIHHGGWDSLNLSENNAIFIICVFASIIHFLIWLQLFVHKTKFDLTIMFPIGYISADIFLLLCYFIQYGIRI